MVDREFLHRLQALTGGHIEWQFEEEAQDPSEAGQVHTEVTEAEVEALYVDSDDEFAVADLTSRTGRANLDEKINEVDTIQPPTKLNKARQAAVLPACIESTRALEQEALGWKETTLNTGDKAPVTQKLCPWKLVSNYPLMFIGERNRPRASPFFEDEAIHKHRIWDFYCIGYPEDHEEAPKRILFVPTYQFENLLAVINATLGDTNLKIPVGKNQSKFELVFGENDTPPARFLGRSTSFEDFKVLKKTILEPDPRDHLHPENPANADFIEKLEMIRQAHKKKRGDKSEKNRQRRIEDRKKWGSSIKRVQRYLGLREKNDVGGDSAKTPDSLDLSKPLSAETEDSVIFAAIDVEAYEMNHNMITEVGIATLDTLDVKGVAPGESGEGWFPLIKAHHFRIRENQWAVNKKHVQGCPQNFLFGKSVILNEDEVVEAIKKVIHIPCSEAQAVKARYENSGGPPHRPVVLVFHDSSQDLKYLHKLGYRVAAFDHFLIDTADTRLMYQWINKTTDAPSLRTVLHDLKIKSSFLHNAGNDSYFTLQCMLGLAIRKRLQSIDKMRNKTDADKSVAGPIPWAEMQPGEGWDSDDASDGGYGFPPVLRKESGPEM